jgi:hypothetical protein
MTTFALPSGRYCGITAGVLNSALVSLAFSSLVSEWSAVSGRPVLIAADIVVGVLGTAAFFTVTTAPVRLALALSALLTVSVTLTPAAAAAALWVGRRRRLPVAIGVAAAGIAGHLVRQAWRPEPDRPLLLWLVFLVGSYAALVAWGAYRRVRRDGTARVAQ